MWVWVVEASIKKLCKAGTGKPKTIPSGCRDVSGLEGRKQL